MRRLLLAECGYVLLTSLAALLGMLGIAAGRKGAATFQDSESRRMRTKDETERCFLFTELDLRAVCVRLRLHKDVPIFLVPRYVISKRSKDGLINHLAWLYICE